MAKIGYNQITANDDSSGNFKVGFFGLKNDGDEAIVRIMHDSVDSFDLVTTHPVQLGNSYRRVNCIREDPREPMDNCPLCKSGAKIQQRFYIHLIQYVKDENNGSIVPQGKVWERSASYATTIKNLLDEYGPLSDCIFKIRRNGAAGSMDTTYSIMFGNPAVYRPELYPKDESIFEGYNVIGTAVMDKNFEEISEFIATGAFPAKQNAEVAQQQANEFASAPVAEGHTPAEVVPPVPSMQPVAQPPVMQPQAQAYAPAAQPVTQVPPVAPASQQRPVRYY